MAARRADRGRRLPRSHRHALVAAALAGKPGDARCDRRRVARHDRHPASRSSRGLWRHLGPNADTRSSGRVGRPLRPGVCQRTHHAAVACQPAHWPLSPRARLAAQRHPRERRRADPRHGAAEGGIHDGCFRQRVSTRSPLRSRRGLRRLRRSHAACTGRPRLE